MHELFSDNPILVKNSEFVIQGPFKLIERVISADDPSKLSSSNPEPISRTLEPNSRPIPVDKVALATTGGGAMNRIHGEHFPSQFVVGFDLEAVSL
jgi:hypothetical protein